MISLNRGYRGGEDRRCNSAGHDLLELLSVFVFEGVDCSLAKERVSAFSEAGDSAQTGLLL